MNLLFSSGLLHKRKDPNPSTLNEIVNDRKPYLGQIYDKPDDFEERFETADPVLKTQYAQIRRNLHAAF